MFSSSLKWRGRSRRIAPLGDEVVEGVHLLADDTDISRPTIETLSANQIIQDLEMKYKSMDPKLSAQFKNIIIELKSSRTQAHMSLTLANASLSLVTDYVIFLSADGTFRSTNHDLHVLLGADVNPVGYVGHWLSANHGGLLPDVLSVLATGMRVSKTTQYWNLPFTETPRVSIVSYEILAVNEAGVVEGATDATTAAEILSSIEAVLIAIRMSPETQIIVSSDNTSIMNESMKNAVESGDQPLELQSIALPDLTETPVPDLIIPLDGLFDITNLGDIIGDISSWDFDVMQFKTPSSLRSFAGYLLTSTFDLSAINVNPNTLAAFIECIQGTYHETNPFHNFYHVTSVTHFLLLIFKASNALTNISPIVLFITAISALAHDADHPGHNNNFEINAQTELSILYGEKSILEHHHIATTFRILRKKSSNILANIPEMEAKKLKRIIISNIISTDLEKHFVLVEKVKKLHIVPPTSENNMASVVWDYTNEAHVTMYCRLMVHAADLSNPVRPFGISAFWSKCISEEFSNQVKEEKRLGLPFAESMIIETEKALCKGEIGFSSFVVAPMWNAISVIFPPLEHLEQQLHSNLAVWRERLAAFD